MSKRFPIVPQHPERICWGCEKYCPADSLMCGNGSIRTPHPSELFGEDWMDFGLDADEEAGERASGPASGSDRPRKPTGRPR